MRALPLHREVVIEMPGPSALERLPSVYGVKLHRVPVDNDGIQTDLLPESPARRRLAYIVPSHQFPLGCVMSIERRLALIAWAARTNAYIIEDDYDSEFAFNGRPTVPLAKLDSAGRVIYACTFSKTLAPALRIGFVVVPDCLLERVAEIKWWTDRGGWFLQQDALAQWIEDGIFEQHIHRMRKLYRMRFEMLVNRLTARLGGNLRVIGQPVGMHVTVSVKTSADPVDIAARARAGGVGVYPVVGAAQQMPSAESAFVFGFGSVATEDIEHGIDIFAGILGAIG
jgi:GntR family transcriptional regulator / MocR family aminotransferase